MNDKDLIEISNYIVENNCTIRFASNIYGMPKSTLHFYIKNRLRKISPVLFCCVNEILKENFRQKHIRGGIATRKKFENIRKNQNTSK